MAGAWSAAIWPPVDKRGRADARRLRSPPARARKTVRQKQDATIALMAKFKPIRPKPRSAPPPKAGLPCVILVILGMFLVMLILYLMMAGQGASQ
jgi:hypothetical protein